MAVLSEFALALVKLILELSDLLLARIRAIAHLRTLQACKPLLDCPHITWRAAEVPTAMHPLLGCGGRSGRGGCGGRSGCSGRRHCGLSRLQLNLRLSRL